MLFHEGEGCERAIIPDELIHTTGNWDVLLLQEFPEASHHFSEIVEIAQGNLEVWDTIVTLRAWGCTCAAN